MTAITMRATYEEVEWLTDEDGDPVEDPEIRGGYTDPHNPWGGFRTEIPEGLVGEPFSAWRDENAETVTFDNVDEAAEFVLDFPGGVWDYCEGEAEQDYRTGVWTSVTLHVDAPHDVVVFNRADEIDAARAAEMAARKVENGASFS